MRCSLQRWSARRRPASPMAASSPPDEGGAHARRARCLHRPSAGARSLGAVPIGVSWLGNRRRRRGPSPRRIRTACSRLDAAVVSSRLAGGRLIPAAGRPPQRAFGRHALARCDIDWIKACSLPATGARAAEVHRKADCRATGSRRLATAGHGPVGQGHVPPAADDRPSRLAWMTSRARGSAIRSSPAGPREFAPRRMERFVSARRRR